MAQQYAAQVDLLVEQMEERLRGGDYAVGDKLPSEPSLARDLRVSRPLVREMLARLRERGYIETLNGRGSFVRPRRSPQMLDVLLKHISIDTQGPYSADDLYKVRSLIECEAAALSSTTATDHDLTALEHLAEKMSAPGIVAEEYTVADTHFHLLISRATQNSLFPALLSPLIDVVVRGIYDSVRTFPEGMHGGNKGHIAILDALRKQDPTTARKAMADHLAYSRSTFPASLLHAHEENEVWPPSIGESSSPIVSK